MVDIEQGMMDAKNLAFDFFKLKDPPDIRISWGSRTKTFATNDPFERIRIDADRVILRYTVGKDMIWLIDMVKGLVMTQFPPALYDTWSGWNFATVIALIIIPSTKITDSKKNQYRKEWIDINTNLNTNEVKFDYGRWYSILSNYPRVQVTELLHTFLTEQYTIGTLLETQFNTYLNLLYQGFGSQEAVDLTYHALKQQTLEVQALMTYLPGLSETTIYRILGQLTFQLNSYYLPNFRNMGLSSLVIWCDNGDHVVKLKDFPYYENFERFADINTHLVKLWVPNSCLMDLIERLQQQVYSHTFIRYSQLSQLRLNPRAFNINTGVWASVITSSHDPVVLDFPGFTENDEVSEAEIRVAQGIVQARSSDFRKLSTYYSQSKTKRLIRRVLSKEMCHPLILWIYPTQLPSKLFILPLTTWHETTWKEAELDLDVEFEKISSILKIPWIFCSVELGQELLERQYRLVAFLRITALEEDFQEIMQQYSAAYVGTYDHKPGTKVSIPVDKFDETWEFDTDELLRILGENMMIEK